MTDGSLGLAEKFGVDAASMRAKYQQERDKRLRADGEDQFIEVGHAGRFSRYLTDDPWAAPEYDREPLTDEVEVAIVGGGWVGLITAARLIEAGVGDVRIIESGSDFGGTWYWNRYPGAQCDVESYIYLPLLEETGYIPKERYSYAPEIYEHAQRIGKHYGLYDKAVFGTWVTGMRWDDQASRWIVSTNRGDEMRARFVSLGTGSASRPRLPGVEGIEDFEGHTFHSSRWDYEYTGGGPEGGLDKLADKRVAVIGTGASGIQLIPHVGRSAKQTFVFQRTPSSVDLRGNKPTDPAWAESLQPGWQKERMRAFDAAFGGGALTGGGADGGADDNPMRMLTVMRQVMAEVDFSNATPDTMREVMEVVGLLTMEQIRERVDEEVHDPEVAERLKPYYDLMCKRPTWNDDYLPTFNLPNVTLVDVSESKGVDRVTKTGVVANGVEYEVDCIIFASGFEVTSEFRRRIGIDVYGEDGRYLYDHWADGMRTLHALTVSGFPNLFMVGGLFGFTLGGLNYTSIIDDQAQHVAHIVTELNRRGALSASPTPEAEDEWIAEQVANPGMGTFGGSPDTCTPGYYNQEGRPMDQRRDSSREGYGKGRGAYVALLEGWRADGSLPGMAVRYGAEALVPD